MKVGVKSQTSPLSSINMAKHKNEIFKGALFSLQNGEEENENWCQISKGTFSVDKPATSERS